MTGDPYFTDGFRIVIELSDISIFRKDNLFEWKFDSLGQRHRVKKELDDINFQVTTETKYISAIELEKPLNSGFHI